MPLQKQLEEAKMESLRSVLQQNLNLDHELSKYTFSVLPPESCLEPNCIEDHRKRLRRSVTSPDLSGPAVMYLPLGGAAPPGCPSIAESAVSGISQMVFLWTVMSVFAAVNNVVANINNNQNNNNNNDNDINFNIVSTQNTQISSNVNNANTISIMLPPPIPVLAGRRSLEAEMRLKRFIVREERLRRKRELSKESSTNQTNSDSIKEQISLTSLDILRFLVEPKGQRFAQNLEHRDCLGRRLCQLSQSTQTMDGLQNVPVLQSALWKLTYFALLYVEIEDHSQAFIHFMEALNSIDSNTIDCEDLFWKCTTDDEYIQ